MNIYADASFLVSAYSSDTNSIAAAELMAGSRGMLWITPLAELEFMNALGLRTFRKQISDAESDASRTAFEHDVSVGVSQLRPLPESVFVRARRLSMQTTAKMGTRTSDLLHIAAALELRADEFYTFDRPQARLASAVNLKTNPVMLS